MKFLSDTKTTVIQLHGENSQTLSASLAAVICGPIYGMMIVEMWVLWTQTPDQSH